MSTIGLPRLGHSTSLGMTVLAALELKTCIHAAGFVVRRLAMKKARANIIKEKIPKTKIEVLTGKSGEALAGKSKARNASVP